MYTRRFIVTEVHTANNKLKVMVVKIEIKMNRCGNWIKTMPSDKLSCDLVQSADVSAGYSGISPYIKRNKIILYNV